MADIRPASSKSWMTFGVSDVGLELSVELEGIEDKGKSRGVKNSLRQGRIERMLSRGL